MSGLDAQLTHVGFFVKDLERMVGFYSRVFGLVVTDRGTNSRGNQVAFLSRNPDEHHQLVLASGRGEEQATTVQQVSFVVAELEDLQRFYPRVAAEGAEDLEPRNHGNAWSVYFNDPEGNRVEVYTPTPWHVSQPYGKPLNLGEPAGVIRERTLAMIQDDPSFASREAWSASLKEKIEAC